VQRVVDQRARRIPLEVIYRKHESLLMKRKNFECPWILGGNLLRCDDIRKLWVGLGLQLREYRLARQCPFRRSRRLPELALR